MKKATREWVGKADDDFRAANRLARGKEPLHDQVCFHCQQSAERSLKALLEELGIFVGKTHDLDRLLLHLVPHHRSLRRLRRGLIFLSPFAVQPRYPGFHATKRQASAALRWAGQVRETCRHLLGPPTPRKRRKRP